MNVPKLRFKEFNDEWKSDLLQNISIITMGQSPNSNNYTDNPNDMLLIQGNADLKNGVVVPRLYTKQITKTCDINDIIMTVRAPVGDIAITSYKACIGRGVCSIKGDKFIYHYLDYLKNQDYWKKISKGSTIDSITSDDIKNLNINTPSKNEMSKITHCIDLINKKIELQTKKIEDLKLFTKKIETQYIFYDDNKYSKKRIDEIFYIKAGGDIKKSNVSSIKTTSFCYPIYSNNLEMNGLFGYSDVYKIEEESITVTGRGDIGKAIKRNGKYYPIVRLLVLIPKINVNLIYMQEAINNLKLIQESTGVPQLTTPQISKYKLLCPSIDIQNKYGKMLFLLQRKIEYEIEKFEKLKELKKGLMQNMFV